MVAFGLCVHELSDEVLHRLKLDLPVVKLMESPRRSSLDFQEQCNSEEVEAKRWIDRAGRYLTEGRYESAIQLLQKTENVFPNSKSLPEMMAVTQVCYAATWRACHCNRPFTRKLPDWYRVLQVS